MYRVEFEEKLKLDNPSFDDNRIQSIMSELSHMSDDELKEYVNNMEESFEEYEEF